MRFIRSCILRAAGIVSLFLATSQAQGQIVQYDFTGVVGNSAQVNASSVASGLTALPVTRGPGVTVPTNPATPSATYAAIGWTTATTRDPDDYFQFGISAVAPGYTYSVTQFSFSMKKSNNTIANKFDFTYSFDGVTFFDIATNVTIPNVVQTVPYSYSNLNLVNLTGPLYFRLYAYAKGNGADTGYLGLTDFTTTSGSVQAVPEPGSMILTGLALAGVGGGAFWRRRKQKTQDTPAAGA